MESNGVRGRIHVSEATAKQLTDRDKGHWLVPRQDKIVAKGKGEMQTYWVTVEGKSTVKGTSVGQSSVSGEDLPGPESIPSHAPNKDSNKEDQEQALGPHTDKKWRQQLKSQFDTAVSEELSMEIGNAGSCKGAF